MSAKENKAIYRRMIDEVWNQGELDVVDEILAPDVVIYNIAPGMPPGREGARASVAMFRGALSGLEVSSALEIAEGDLVANYWTVRGTHSGELMGIPPTGKQIEFRGMSVVRIKDGNIVEIWGESDQLGLMQQLGAIPAPGQG